MRKRVAHFLKRPSRLALISSCESIHSNAAVPNLDPGREQPPKPLSVGTPMVSEMTPTIGYVQPARRMSAPQSARRMSTERLTLRSTASGFVTRTPFHDADVVPFFQALDRALWQKPRLAPADVRGNDAPEGLRSGLLCGDSMDLSRRSR